MQLKMKAAGRVVMKKCHEAAQQSYQDVISGRKARESRESASRLSKKRKRKSRKGRKDSSASGSD